MIVDKKDMKAVEAYDLSFPRIGARLAFPL